MRFSPNFLDEIRARLPVSQVVGRKVALKKAGREFRGLSPFKAEKTPSFFVNDQKGFYHCFASGEHGDIFTFLMKTEGLEFPEAVERLAAEAGIQMPKPTERNVEQEDQRDRLYRLLEASALFFEECLRSGAGAEARRYLERRGLARETIQTFRLGFAPGSRTALAAHLKAKGFTPGDMADGRNADRRRRHRRALRPVPQPRHVPDPRPQRPRHRLWRPGARKGCPRQVPQLAGDAALSQGRIRCSTPRAPDPPRTTRAA